MSEMAQDGADGWSSQEGEVPLPPAQGQPQQEAQAQWQFPSPGGPGSSGAAAAAPSAGRAYSGGQQGGARYVCSLTSQEASELSDPWSQPEDEAEEQRRQQQREEEERQHAELEAAAMAEQQLGGMQVRAGCHFGGWLLTMASDCPL